MVTGPPQVGGLIGQTPGLSCQRSTRVHDDIIFTADAIKNDIILHSCAPPLSTNTGLYFFLL